MKRRLSNQQERVHLKLDGQTLHQKDTRTYLRITMDRRLTWKNQLLGNQARAKISLALGKKLLCTEWGADQNMLRKALCRENLPSPWIWNGSKLCHCKIKFKQAIQSAAPGHENDDWRHAEHTYIGHGDSHRSATYWRQEIKVLMQTTKFRRLQDHPMHERMNQPTRGGLKRSNFLQHSRILKRRNPELLDHMPKPIPSVKSYQDEPLLETTSPKNVH